MGEFLQGVYDDFKSRIESPLLFSIFISWICWNSNFVWFLLVGESHGKYYQIIEWQFNFWKFWVLPIMTAPILILVIPAANNLLMLYRYRLLSSFQHKVQESKGKYTAALELVLLQKKTEELELRTKAQSEKETAYIEAKLKLDSDRLEYEHQAKISNMLRINPDYINWPTKKAAYDSKLQRLESRGSNNIESVDNSIVSIGSYVTLAFDPVDNENVTKSLIVEGYLDDLILTEVLPVNFATNLVGKSIGGSVTGDYSVNPGGVEERYRVEVMGIGKL